MLKKSEGEIVVLTAIAGAEHAATFAMGLIEQRLAACVTRIPGGISKYYWQDETPTEESEEVLLIKTHAIKLAELENYFEQEHPYEVPEFMIIEPDKISTAYSAWMKQEMKL